MYLAKIHLSLETSNTQVLSVFKAWFIFAFTPDMNIRLMDTYGQSSDLGIGQQKRDVDGLSTLFKCVTDWDCTTEGLQTARRNDHDCQFLYLVAS